MERDEPCKKITLPGTELYVPDSYWKQVIFHVDVNYFYAQVETVYYPSLRGKPVAVVGDEEERSGIVLTATPQAKLRGVKTAMVYWEAERLCPDIIFVRANYKRYKQMSQRIRKILARFTNQVEPFGLDECWMDVTGSLSLFGPPMKMAQMVADMIRAETSLTVSIGVSHNKTLAKLGSDYRKPDAITVLHNYNWQEITFPLPVSDMMMIGQKTNQKLYNLGIYTIGQLATMPPELLVDNFGKMGIYYWLIANGLDQSQVLMEGDTYKPKDETIGNSQTAPYDLVTEEEVRCQLLPIVESVAARVRKANYSAWGVAAFLRDNQLHGKTRQMKLAQPTCLARDIMEATMALYRRHEWGQPLRAVGTRALYLADADMPYQVDFSCDATKQAELVSLEKTKDVVRTEYGNKSLVVAREYSKPELSGLDIQTQNTIHPDGYMHTA